VILLSIVVVWAICGVLAYGLTLHHFTEKFPAYKHHELTRLVVLLGPGGLVAAFLGGRPYGLRFRHLSPDERLAIFLREYPGLTAADFERHR
jgi:hypothetical protein